MYSIYISEMGPWETSEENQEIQMGKEEGSNSPAGILCPLIRHLSKKHLSPVEGQDQSIIIGRRFVRGGAAIP
jgi:hypothetical protein